MSQKRTRRSPQEARARILEVAERRLAKGGPEAIRLKDIAEELGISHPAILHHFGTRDGLVAALEEHAMTNLQRDLLERIEASAEEGFARAFATLGEAGHARLLAWQILRAAPGEVRDEVGMLRTLADAYHEARVAAARESGRGDPEYEDTAYWVRLAALALFGEALIGPLLTESGNLGEVPETHERFQRWLASLFDRET